MLFAINFYLSVVSGLFLLIGFAVVLDPAANVFSPGVMMCPVDDTAFRIPFVLPVKIDPVTCLQVLDSRRQIDVVADQDGFVSGQNQDEFLVAGTVIVVGKDALDSAGALDLNIALLIGKGMLESNFRFHGGRL